MIVLLLIDVKCRIGFTNHVASVAKPAGRWMRNPWGSIVGGLVAVEFSAPLHLLAATSCHSIISTVPVYAFILQILLIRAYLVVTIHCHCKIEQDVIFDTCGGQHGSKGMRIV